MIPIERSEQLPAVGSAVERASLDFKAKHTSDRRECAKDIAAFANGVGGAILVGAAANGEVLARYLPLSEVEASACQRDYEEAARDRCRPTPLIETVQIPVDGGRVVALNVYPVIGQPVGVRLLATDQVNSDGVYHYPVRVGAHTTSIHPEQLPVFIDVKTRKVLSILSDCEGGPVRIHGSEDFAPSGPHRICLARWWRLPSEGARPHRQVRRVPRRSGPAEVRHAPIHGSSPASASFEHRVRVTAFPFDRSTLEGLARSVKSALERVTGKSKARRR